MTSDIQVTKDGTEVYINGENCADHVELIYISEMANRSIKVYSAHPISRDEAIEYVGRLYDDGKITLHSDRDEVEDVWIE